MSHRSLRVIAADDRAAVKLSRASSSMVLAGGDRDAAPRQAAGEKCRPNLSGRKDASGDAEFPHLSVEGVTTDSE